MRELAARVGISDVGLRKLLHGHGIATPPQSHWNREKAGRKVPEPPAAQPRRPGESGRIRLDARFRSAVADAGSWPVGGPFATALVPESLEELHAAVLAKTLDVKVPRLATRVHRGVVKLVRTDSEQAARRAARGWRPEPQPFTGAFWHRQLRLWNALFLALDAYGADGSAYGRDGRLVASARVGDTTVPLDLEPVGKVRKGRYANYKRPASDLPALTPLRLMVRTGEGSASWKYGPDRPLEGVLREVVAGVIPAGEAGFRRGLREHRDWLLRIAAMDEEARQRRLAAEEAARAAKLVEHAAALRGADNIRVLVARVRDAPDDTLDRHALATWCSWALARADRIDPVLSGALASGFGLSGLRAATERGAT